jgi:hypothetical protein
MFEVFGSDGQLYALNQGKRRPRLSSQKSAHEIASTQSMGFLIRERKRERDEPELTTRDPKSLWKYSGVAFVENNNLIVQSNSLMNGFGTSFDCWRRDDRPMHFEGESIKVNLI